MKYHGHEIKVIKPTIYNDLDGKIYEVYKDGEFLITMPFLASAKEYIDSGYKAIL